MASDDPPGTLAGPNPRSTSPHSPTFHRSSGGTPDSLKQLVTATDGPDDDDAALCCTASVKNTSTVEIPGQRKGPFTFLYDSSASLQDESRVLLEYSLNTACGTAFPPGLRELSNRFDVPFSGTQSGHHELNMHSIGIEETLTPNEAYSLSSLNIVASTMAQTQHSAQCEICGRSLTTRDNLRRHNRSVHQDQLDPVYWCKCGKTDTRKDNHIRHVGTCTRNAVFAYYCCKCGTENAESGRHLRHVRPCDYFFSRNTR